MTQDSSDDAQEHSLDESGETNDLQSSSASNEDVKQEKNDSDKSEDIDELDLCRSQAAESHDKYVRIVAELENYRRRGPARSH